MQGYLIKGNIVFKCSKNFLMFQNYFFYKNFLFILATQGKEG